MDFTTFKNDTMQYLWRPNDSALADAMPKIIRTAENRMRVDLKVTDSDVTFNEAVTTYPAVTLPADADRVTSVQWSDYGPGIYVTPANFSQSSGQDQLVPGAIPRYYPPVSQMEYTVQGRDLRHRWNSASVDTPVNMTLVYTPRPASLVDDDDTLYNEYTAMYEACVYTEASRFLLNDDRAAAFDSIYMSRMGEAAFEQSNRKFAGSPLRVSMPSVVA